jgi:signal transduction histidine kinase
LAPEEASTVENPPEATGRPLDELVELRRRIAEIDVSDSERELVEKALKKFCQRLDEMVVQRTKELRVAQERLAHRERLAALGELAGGIGHELRNPLGTIKNAAYFLRKVLEEPAPQVQEALRILDHEVARSEAIIRSLVDLTRARPPARQEVDVNEVIREVLSRAELPDNVEVVCHLDVALPAVLADGDQLRQVFDNIILNGIQAITVFSGEGTGDGGQLLVESQAAGAGWVAVSVTDTGAGIPEEDLERIFEPLFTTKAEGIGLGLGIVAALVEGHGGTVEVESRVGEGSTFTVRLPLAKRT